MENACEGLLRNHLTQFIRQQTSKPGLMTKPASDSDKPGVILVIGSCASENVLIADKVIELGQKHFVRHTERWGGGGLNYTFRLIKTGHPVLPILSVGDDWSGNKMREEIKRMTKENIRDREVAQQVIRFVEGKDFFCKGISTQQSFVVVAPSQYHVGDENISREQTINKVRTIYMVELEWRERFKVFVERRLDRLADIEDGLTIRAVIIAHIHADGEEEGEITKEIIRRYRGKAKIFANFGQNQFLLGDSFWKDDLRDVTLFQLSLSEVRKFFGNNDKVNSLEDSIRWFRDNHISAVITLNKLGAIATHGDGHEGVIHAWPIVLEDMKDSTGAGDAFGAALVSGLYKKDEVGFEDLRAAIKKARVWAAYACRTIGGANEPPDMAALNKFEADVKGRGFDDSYGIESYTIKHADTILRLVDLAYPLPFVGLK